MLHIKRNQTTVDDVVIAAMRQGDKTVSSSYSTSSRSRLILLTLCDNEDDVFPANCDLTARYLQIELAPKIMRLLNCMSIRTGEVYPYGAKSVGGKYICYT